MGHAKVYLRTKFEVSRYIHSKFMKGGPKFRNFASELPTHPLWGNFVICKMGHVKIYLCTKFDVSSYSRSKFTKGGPKFTNLAPKRPPHPTWGNFVIREMGHVNIYPCTKFEVSIFARFKFMDFVMIHTANSSPFGRGMLWLCWLQENDVTLPGWSAVTSKAPLMQGFLGRDGTGRMLGRSLCIAGRAGPLIRLLRPGFIGPGRASF